MQGAAAPTTRRGLGISLEELALLLCFATISYDYWNPLGASVSQTSGDAFLSLDKITVVLALGFWALRSLVTKEGNRLAVLLQSPVTYLIFALLIISALSNINAPPTDSFRGVGGPWLTVIRRVTLVFMYFSLVLIIQSERMLLYLILAYLIGGLVDCYAGIYEMITAEQFIEEMSWGRTELNASAAGQVRIQGISPDGNVHTFFTLFGTALIPYVWHVARGPLKLVVLLVLGVYVANVIGSSSKAGWLGLVMLLAVYVAITEDPAKWRIALLAVLGGVAGFVILSFNSNLIVSLEKITGHSYSNTMRIGYVEMMWEMVKDHPILGAGTGAFGWEYHRYFPAGNGAVPFTAAPSGNAYMQVWAENGTLGLLAMLAIYGAVFLAMWVGMKNAPTASLKMLGATLIGLFAVTLFTIAVYPIWDSKYLWMTIGLAAAYGNLPEVQPRPVDERALLDRPAAAEPRLSVGRA